TASGSGSDPRGAATGGTSAAADPKATSSGRSRNTGPRCGVRARVTASATSLGTSAVDVTVRADLEMLATIGTWSSSWSDPAPQRNCGARPARTTSGDPLSLAVVMALTPLVTPGPAVSTATPGRRVSLASPSAANVAVCSWRTSTMRHPAFT